MSLFPSVLQHRAEKCAPKESSDKPGKSRDVFCSNCSWGAVVFQSRSLRLCPLSKRCELSTFTHTVSFPKSWVCLGIGCSGHYVQTHGDAVFLLKANTVMLLATAMLEMARWLLNFLYVFIVFSASRKAASHSQ